MHAVVFDLKFHRQIGVVRIGHDFCFCVFDVLVQFTEVNFEIVVVVRVVVVALNDVLSSLEFWVVSDQVIQHLLKLGFVDFAAVNIAVAKRFIALISRALNSNLSRFSTVVGLIGRPKCGAFQSKNRSDFCRSGGGVFERCADRAGAEKSKLRENKAKGIIKCFTVDLVLLCS